MSVRRVKGKFTNLEVAKDHILASSLLKELHGVAFDSENEIVYISNANQHPISYWRKFGGKVITPLDAWESKESIKEFATRNSFTYLEGKSKDAFTYNFDNLKERILKGTPLESLEVEIYMMDDANLIDLMISRRAELLVYEQNILRIKENAIKNPLGNTPRF